jgi:hypothetical protein
MNPKTWSTLINFEVTKRLRLKIYNLNGGEEESDDGFTWTGYRIER